MYVPSYIRMTRAPSFVPVLFYLGRGNQFTGDEVTLSTTSHPNFLVLFRPLSHLFVFEWSRARSFAKVIDYATVRSPFVTLLLPNNAVRRLAVPKTTTVLRDVVIVALGVHVFVVLTHTPLVNEDLVYPSHG